jgi:hypothetical protein
MTRAIWTDAAAQGALGWVTMRIAAALMPAERRRLQTPSSEIPPEVFCTTFICRATKWTDLRKATELALPQLMPIALTGLIVFARKTENGAELAAFRSDDLNAWQSDLQKQNADLRIHDGWWTKSPKALRAAHRQRRVLVSALAVWVCALWLAQQALLFNLESKTAALLSEEAVVRAEALAVAQREAQADVWSSLKAADAESRLPTSVLASIVELSRVTPGESYWTRIEWSPLSAILYGTSKDPIALLAELSTIPGHTASFSAPMVPTGEFQVTVKRSTVEP